MRFQFFITLVIVSSVTFMSLVGCSAIKPDADTHYPKDLDDTRREKRGKLTGEDGIVLFGDKRGNKDNDGSLIGVNSYLWRASLDTLNFMPLSQVDPHGGVILTDWYENPEIGNERFKLNVVILGSALRADGVRVSVFKQDLRGGVWRDATPNADVARELEEKILTRARELRVNSATDD